MKIECLMEDENSNTKNFHRIARINRRSKVIQYEYVNGMGYKGEEG